MRLSQPIADALKAGDRSASHTTKLGGKSVGPQIQSWSVERSYDTDLPPAMRAFSGSASAQLSLELGGTGDANAPALYGPWAPHATADIARPGQSVTHSWGMNGTNLPAFRGTVRSRSAVSGTDTVSLTALDGAERLRAPAQLPAPGLGVFGGQTFASTTWCADHLLRSAGFHSCPPPRQGCIFYASLHGGAQPDIGSLAIATDVDGWTSENAPWSSALKTTQEAGKETYAGYWPETRLSSVYSGGIFMEVWADNRGAVPASGRTVSIEASWGTGTIAFRVDFPAGKVTMTLGTSVLTSTVSALTTQSGRWHLAAHILLDPAGGKPTAAAFVTAPDGQQFIDTPRAFATSMGSSTMNGVSLRGAGLRLEGLQVTKMPARPSGATVTQRGQWVRGASVDSPTGYLYAIPRVSGTTWDVLSQIAQASLSTVELREDGTVAWRNPSRFTTAPGTANVTVTSAREISALTLTDEIDACRNQVRVPFQAWNTAGLDPDPGYFLDDGIHTVTPGSSWTARVQLPDADFDPLYPPFVDADATTTNTSILITAANGFPLAHAAEITGKRQLDGSYEVTVVNVTSGNIDVRRLVVRYVRADSEKPATTFSWMSQSAPSQRWFGTQLFELPESPWIQRWDEAVRIADLLRDAGAFPAPLLGDVDILPDPRIQLGDVVRVVDRTGAALDTLAWVVGIKTSGGADAVTQTLTLRGAAYPGPPTDAGLVPDPPVDPAAGSTA